MFAKRKDNTNTDNASYNLENEKSKTRKPSVLENHGYFVDQIIGAGTFAFVKRAYSRQHDRVVAIKVLSKSAYNMSQLEKFVTREINVVKGLRHENLIKYYQAIETTHRFYIIMEYAENGSLLNYLQHNRTDEKIAQKWFKQIVSAVEYCLSNGVVHRDLKCENLLLDADYNIKLSDFGFARDDMIEENGKIKISDTFCGSKPYAAPEILNSIPYNPNKSDIWSIGVILYAIVFKTMPFDENDNIECSRDKVTFPEDVIVSDDCKQMIKKLLAPLSDRLSMSEIKKEPWFTNPTKTWTPNKRKKKVPTSPDPSTRQLAYHIKRGQTPPPPPTRICAPLSSGPRRHHKLSTCYKFGRWISDDGSELQEATAETASTKPN